MQPGVDPLWNVTMFKKTVDEIVSCHYDHIYDLVQLDPIKLYRLLDPIFNTTARSFDSVLYHMLYWICQCRLSEKTLQNFHINNPRVSLIQYIKDHPRFQSEFSWVDSVYKTNFISLLSNSKATGIPKSVLNFLLTLDDERKAVRESRREAFKEKGEEIVAIAWAPERFRDWCLSSDERTDLMNRWY